jgi:hypothetical protein
MEGSFSGDAAGAERLSSRHFTDMAELAQNENELSASVRTTESGASPTENIGSTRRQRRPSPGLRREQFFQRLPLAIWVLSGLVALAGWFSANPVLTPFAILLLPLLASLLWFPGEPPALLFACAMQWLQATAAIFYTDFYGMPLSQDWEFGGPEMVKATWLSLIGVLVVALGMRLALIRRKREALAEVAKEARLLQPDRIFVLYLIAFAVFSVVGRVAWSIPSLVQPILATMTLKWVLVFLLAHSVLRQRRHYVLLGIAVGLEFVIGLLGFFAGFKNIFFMLLVVLPVGSVTFTGRRLVQFCALAALMLVLAAGWSVIKPDYREFLNRGSGQQEVLAPLSQRVEKLGELVGGVNQARFQDGLEEAVLRMSYVKFFALTMANVPAEIPYEKGALWLGAVKHVLMPRFLFPNKEAINDSDRTSYYTGIQVATAEQGTSIGIGYMGESYIDFGPIGMFAPILLLGLFYGFIYRFFVNRHPVKVVGFAMATAILIFGACTIETSNIKLFGGNLMSLIVMGLFAKFAGSWFWRLITSQGRAFPLRRKAGTVAARPGRRPKRRLGAVVKIED